LLISHAASSLARNVLEPLLVPRIIEGWTTVLQDERFALRSPLLHAPSLEAAIGETRSTGLIGAAKLLLAAAPAVGVSLPDGWLQVLHKIKGGNPEPGPAANQQS